MREPTDQTNVKTASRSNGRLAVVLFFVVGGMIGLSFASVPLYRIFCQVTGYGGTTQVATELPEEVSERVIKVRFNADINEALPWHFQPAQREIALHVGESSLAFYEARNLSDRTLTGSAVFNVTPLKAGQYFNKIQCFCFDEQTLTAGQKVDMPVSFFIDPAINEDRNLDDVKTITLSYTFYPALEQDAEPQQGLSGRAAPEDKTTDLQRASLD